MPQPNLQDLLVPSDEHEDVRPLSEVQRALDRIRGYNPRLAAGLQEAHQSIEKSILNAAIGAESSCRTQAYNAAIALRELLEWCK